MRTFIAINVSPQIRQVLSDIQEILKKTDADVKWVDPKNIHLTLKFLGEIKQKQSDIIKETLSHKISFQTITSSLDKIGTFPEYRNPRVIWAGISDKNKNIANLAGILENELGLVGFKKESGIFKPHLTIGRIRSSKNCSSLMEKIESAKIPTSNVLTIDEVTFYKSTLTPTGPVYEAISTIKARA